MQKMKREGEGEESKTERVEKRVDETAEMKSARVEYSLRKGVPCPDLATTKDFLRFHIALSQGRIKDKTTVDLVKTFAKWFFAGFTQVTETVISEDYRSSIYGIPFIIDIFCWTGTRIGAFFPNPDNKDKGGLYYKDIEVVLLRMYES
ncbi:hypothetical protein FGG08_000008 [Glutinoglossum americanum]|uniref:Uncharacterized protein n=1 Tax=Glutinoglossum americanum TaxID=1670608 RepID=A0A9P8IGY4_9PEZI|nr:hypothetical protein FGG08_000008 [Glutinoglossum americanum]